MTTPADVTTLKPLAWASGSHDELCGFPHYPRTEAGHQLYQVQLGITPTDSKLMSRVGAGVRELRIQAANRTHFRVFYWVTPKHVWVLHAFKKNQNNTPPVNISTGQRRYAEANRREAAG